MGKQPAIRIYLWRYEKCSVKPFYFQSIRKYVALFGALFQDISIERRNTANTITEFIRVPISYSAKEKMLARVQEDPTITRASATPTMPLMSFEMGNFTYDGDRKLPSTNRTAYVANTSANQLKYQYTPVPYNIEFKLYIMVKNTEDATKIVEQILPYFTPDFTTNLKLIPEVNREMEIPTILTGVSQEDTYDGKFEDRQSLVWTLSFVMKAYLFGPITKIPQIKYVYVNFYTPNVADGQLATAVGNSAIVATIEEQPGLTANGQPTSNIALSISPADIYVTEDFGYIIQVTEPGEGQ